MKNILSRVARYFSLAFAAARERNVIVNYKTKEHKAIRSYLRSINFTVQFLAASFAIFTFGVWLHERPVRFEEQSLRRTDLTLKSIDLIARYKGGDGSIQTDAALEYLFGRSATLNPCGFNFGKIKFTGLSISDLSVSSCDLEFDIETNLTRLNITTKQLYMVCESNCNLQSGEHRIGPSYNFEGRINAFLVGVTTSARIRGIISPVFAEDEGERSASLFGCSFLIGGEDWRPISSKERGCIIGRKLIFSGVIDNMNVGVSELYSPSSVINSSIVYLNSNSDFNLQNAVLINSAMVHSADCSIDIDFCSIIEDKVDGACYLGGEILLDLSSFHVIDLPLCEGRASTKFNELKDGGVGDGLSEESLISIYNGGLNNIQRHFLGPLVLSE